MAPSASFVVLPGTTYPMDWALHHQSRKYPTAGQWFPALGRQKQADLWVIDQVPGRSGVHGETMSGKSKRERKEKN